MNSAFKFFGITILSSIQLFSQTATLEHVGEIVEQKEWSRITAIVGYDDDDFTYVLRFRDSRFLEKIDSEMNIVQSAELKTSYSGESTTFLKVLMVQGNLIVFHEMQDQTRKLKRLFYQPLDNITLLTTGKPVEIATIDYDDGSKKNSGSFSVSSAFDKFLVSYELPYEKNEKVKLNFIVFNADMKEMWSRHVELPYTQALYSVSSKSIDSSGNVYVMAQAYTNEDKTYENQTLRLLIFKPEPTDRIELTYDLPEKIIMQHQLVIRDTGDLQIAGFYSEKEPNIYISGSFSIRINKASYELTSTDFEPFSEELNFSYLLKQQKKKLKKNASKGKAVGLANYRFKKIVKRTDGGLFIVAEQYWRTTFDGPKTPYEQQKSSIHQTNDPNRAMVFDQYQNILVVSVSPAGKVDWAKIVPKFQKAPSPDGKNISSRLSFNIGYISNKLVLVYNDMPENLNLSIDSEPKLFYTKAVGSAITVCATVDVKGEIVKNKLFSYQEDELVYSVLSPGTLFTKYVLIYLNSNNKERLSKVLIQ